MAGDHSEREPEPGGLPTSSAEPGRRAAARHLRTALRRGRPVPALAHQRPHDLPVGRARAHGHARDRSRPGLHASQPDRRRRRTAARAGVGGFAAERATYTDAGQPGGRRRLQQRSRARRGGRADRIRSRCWSSAAAKCLPERRWRLQPGRRRPESPTNVYRPAGVLAGAPRRHRGQIRFVCSHSDWQEMQRVDEGSASSLSAPISFPQSSHIP
jgi:hypothetical protein